MILTAQITPAQFTGGAFCCMTRIMIQVRGPGTLFLACNQGEAANQGDGVQLTQGSTQLLPWQLKWKGDLWYSTDTPGQQFVLLIIGEDD